MNTITFDFYNARGKPAKFPAQTYSSTAQLLEEVYKEVPRLFQFILRSRIQESIAKLEKMYAKSGTNRNYIACPARARPGEENRLLGYQYPVCFPMRHFTSIDDLLNTLCRGIWNNSDVHRLLKDVMSFADSQIPHAFVKLTPEITLAIPGLAVVPGIQTIHDLILNQLTTQSDRETYCRQVVQAVDDDKLHPTVIPNPPRGVFTISINVGRESVSFQTIEYESIRTLITHMRSSSSSQNAVGFLLENWRGFATGTLQQLARGRRKRRALEDEQPRIPDYMVVEIDVVDYTRFGTCHRPLLKIVPYPTESQQLHQTYDNIQYFHLCPKYFNSIRLSLKSPEGEIFPDSCFRGETLAVVHIRPKHVAGTEWGEET